MQSDQSSIRRSGDVSVCRLKRSSDIRPLDQIAAAEKHAHLRITQARRLHHKIPHGPVSRRSPRGIFRGMTRVREGILAPGRGSCASAVLALAERPSPPTPLPKRGEGRCGVRAVALGEFPSTEERASAQAKATEDSALPFRQGDA